MFYIFFILLLLNMLHAGQILDILYVDDSSVNRTMTARIMKNHNSKVLTRLLAFLERKEHTTLHELTIKNNDTAARIREAIAEDPGFREKREKFSISRDETTVSITNLINFLMERDTLTIYQVALAQLIYSIIPLQQKIDDSLQMISFSTLKDGNELTLDVAVKQHIILLDIQMPGENGDVTLARIKSLAEARRTTLPFIIAITTLGEYHSIDGKLSPKALSHHFNDGRDKIKTQDHLTEVLALYKRHIEEKQSSSQAADDTLELKSVSSFDSDEEKVADQDILYPLWRRKVKPLNLDDEDILKEQPRVNFKHKPKDTTNADENVDPLLTHDITPISSDSTSLAATKKVKRSQATQFLSSIFGEPTQQPQRSRPSCLAYLMHKLQCGF
ncbi:MAG: hypothetical protein ACK4V2_01265 [Pseudomonadota bacterium]|jgi:CheY-like chemotaxis protein|nr:hypothetical protein [Alphaproteobacteria bacterium]